MPTFPMPRPYPHGMTMREWAEFLERADRMMRNDGVQTNWRRVVLGPTEEGREARPTRAIRVREDDDGE